MSSWGTIEPRGGDAVEEGRSRRSRFAGAGARITLVSGNLRVIISFYLMLFVKGHGNICWLLPAFAMIVVTLYEDEILFRLPLPFVTPERLCPQYLMYMANM